MVILYISQVQESKRENECWESRIEYQYTWSHDYPRSFTVQKLQQPRFPPLAATTRSYTSFSVKTLTQKASVYEIRSEWVKRLQFLVSIGDRIVSYLVIRILVKERRPRALNTYQMH